MKRDSCYKQIQIPQDEEDAKGIKKLWEQFSLWWFMKTRHSWYRRNIVNPFHDFQMGIKNIIKWLPLIWKDRDWGDYQIYEVLQFKIKNTRDLLIKNKICIEEDLQMINRDMTICLNLIEKIKLDFYEMEYLDYTNDTYFQRWVQADSHKEILPLELYFKKYKNEHRKVLNSINTKTSSNIAFLIGQNVQEKAKKLLYKILQEKMGYWWD